MTFLQLVISSPLILELGQTHQDSNPGPQIERQMTYQLSYPSALLVLFFMQEIDPMCCKTQRIIGLLLLFVNERRTLDGF